MAKTKRLEKDKKMKKTRAALLIAASWAGLCLAAPLETCANSAQSDWEGTRANGAVVKEGECPLIVEQELLTFDIPEFPESHYESREQFLAYSGNVSAEHTFYNPEDYSVTATLVFPFGKVPEYGFQYDTATLQPVYGADTASRSTGKRLRSGSGILMRQMILRQSVIWRNCRTGMWRIRFIHLNCL